MCCDPNETRLMSTPTKARSSPQPSALFWLPSKPPPATLEKVLPWMKEYVSYIVLPTKSPQATLEAVLSGLNGPGRARTNRAGTALTDAVRTGLQHFGHAAKCAPTHTSTPQYSTQHTLHMTIAAPYVTSYTLNRNWKAENEAIPI